MEALRVWKVDIHGAQLRSRRVAVDGVTYALEPRAAHLSQNVIIASLQPYGLQRDYHFPNRPGLIVRPYSATLANTPLKPDALNGVTFRGEEVDRIVSRLKALPSYRAFAPAVAKTLQPVLEYLSTCLNR